MAVEVVNGGGGANLQSKTDPGVTPNTHDQTITAGPGYDGLSAVKVKGDLNLTSANIRKGIRIFDETGTCKTYTLLDINAGNTSIADVGGSNYLKIDLESYGLQSTSKLLGMFVTFRYSKNGSGNYSGAVCGFATGGGTTMALVCGRDDNIQTYYYGWATTMCILQDGYFMVELSPYLDDTHSATLEILSLQDFRRVVFEP